MEKKKILIVEDEADLRSLLVEGLEEAGYEVYEAENGEDALAKVADSKPNLIVSDVLMPKKDGNQFYKEMRASDFGKNIPFIILTARVAMRDYFEVVGVTYFIEKPVQMAGLLERISAALDNRPITVGSPPVASPDQRPEEKKEGQKPPEKKQYKDIKISDVSPETASVVADLSVGEEEKKDHRIRFEEKKKKDEERQVRLSKLNRKNKILAVEDDVIVCSGLQELLSKKGCYVEIVHTYEQCLDDIKHFLPDLIVLKHYLGESNAERIADQLKGSQQIAEIPIIIYDSISESFDKVQETSDGSRTFILNDQGKDLISRIDKILGL